jgi:hypothetical protein
MGAARTTVTNKQLKDLIDAGAQQVKEAVRIMTEAAGHVLLLHAEVKDLAAEINKQTALADEVHKHLKEQDAEHTADIKEMREMIKGNGKAGLETNVATIATELASMKRLLYLLLAPIYAGLLAIGFALVQANMQPASASYISPTPIIITVTPPASYFTHIPIDRPTATIPWQPQR